MRQELVLCHFFTFGHRLFKTHVNRRIQTIYALFAIEVFDGAQVLIRAWVYYVVSCQTLPTWVFEEANAVPAIPDSVRN